MADRSGNGLCDCDSQAGLQSSECVYFKGKKLEHMKVGELREELKLRGLPTKGLKSSLVTGFREALLSEKLLVRSDHSLSHSDRRSRTEVIGDREVFGDREDRGAVIPDKFNRPIGEEKMIEGFGRPLVGSDGGDMNDMWCSRWRRVVRCQCRQYDVPRGSVGRDFIGVVTEEIAGLTRCESKSERLIVFMAVILQRDSLVKKSW